MNKVNKIIILLLLITFYSCGDKNKKEAIEGNEIGKYLYLADNGVLHTDRECLDLKYGKTYNGHKVYGMKIIDIIAIKSDENIRYCKTCVTDEHYERIQAMIERNKFSHRISCRPAKVKPIGNKLKEIYTTLKGGGADVGSEEEFGRWFLASGAEGYKNRLNVYNTFKDCGADVGKDYNEFAAYLGLHASKKKGRGY